MTLIKFSILLTVAFVATTVFAQPPPDFGEVERMTFEGVRRYFAQPSRPKDLRPFIPKEIQDLFPEIRKRFFGESRSLSKVSFFPD